MAFIPADAKWYLADLVLAITVGRQRTTVVHINTLLVRANSPDEAYARALELGEREEMQYENVAGERVRFRFLGLRDLAVIHDDLEHGAELSYQEKEVRTVRDARKFVTPKRKLGVFAPIRKRRGPDYASGELVRELNAWMEERSGPTSRRNRSKPPRPRTTRK